MMGELQERLDVTSSIAESFTVMMHRTDSAEWLLAGIRDSSGGLELMPRQGARFFITGLLLTAASRARTLGAMDVAFVHQMLGRFLPGVETPEDAENLVRALERSGMDSDVDEQIEMIDELAVVARAHGDEVTAAALSRDLRALVADFQRGWEGENTPLDPMATPPYDTRPLGAHVNQSGASNQGTRHPVLGCLGLLMILVFVGSCLAGVVPGEDKSCSDIADKLAEGRGSFSLGDASEDEVWWYNANCP